MQKTDDFEMGPFKWDIFYPPSNFWDINNKYE